MIDYTGLNRSNHSKLKLVARIDHEGEVLKCRASPKKQGLFASMTNSGLVNLYQLNGLQSGKSTRMGTLLGLTSETFSLSWNRKQENLICSGSGSDFCIWDINSNLKTD